MTDPSESPPSDYDMFHPEHARQLNQAKKTLQNVHLIVCDVNNGLTNHLRGRAVLPEAWRYEYKAHKAPSHNCCVVSDALWIIGQEYLSQNNIDFHAPKDILYKTEGHEDVYKHIKDLGMFVTIVEYIHNLARR